MHHCPSNCHTHDIQQFVGVASGSFPAPDHEYPSHLELRLDGDRQRRTAEHRERAPESADGDADVPVQPHGTGARRQRDVGGDAVHAARSSSARATPSARRRRRHVGSTSYGFSSWSDGGAQVHNVTAPASAATYTATYTPVTSAPGLVAAYAFNEGSGSTTADATGKGHTGSLVGATWTTAGKNGNALVVQRHQQPRLGCRRGRSRLVDGADDGSVGQADHALGLADGRAQGSAGRVGLRACTRTTTRRGRPAPSTRAAIDVNVPGAAALPLNTWTHLAMTYDGCERAAVS